METDLLNRRLEVIEAHKKLEKTRGSGWHPADPGALEREQKNEPTLSERPVAFQVDDRIHVVGPCVDVIKSALQRFLLREEDEAQSLDMIGNGPRYMATTIKCCRRVLEQQGDELVLPTVDWNYCGSALAVEGIQVVLVGV